VAVGAKAKFGSKHHTQLWLWSLRPTRILDIKADKKWGGGQKAELTPTQKCVSVLKFSNFKTDPRPAPQL